MAPHGLNLFDTALVGRVGTPSGPTAGWKELGRTTLGSSGDELSVSSLPNKRYYMVISSILSTTNNNIAFRANSDTGSNYGYRFELNHGTEFTAGSLTNAFMYAATESSNAFSVFHVDNKSDLEKLIIQHNVIQETAGAGTAPSRNEGTNKWANSTDAIDEIIVRNSSTGDYLTDSECVVLGWDPADTHTENFWEELVSANGDGTGGYSTGTFTAKKYLWMEIINDKSASTSTSIQFNSDTGSNYAVRWSRNGAADSTATSHTSSGTFTANSSTPSFTRLFAMNISDEEKLCYVETVDTSTAGETTAPARTELIFKWTNTASQITDVTLTPVSGNLTTTSQINIWGSD